MYHLFYSQNKIRIFSKIIRGFARYICISWADGVNTVIFICHISDYQSGKYYE